MNYTNNYTNRFPFSFLDRVLLCSPGWPQTCDPPVSSLENGGITGTYHPARILIALLKSNHICIQR
jgi:hypothetical protein